MTTDDEQDVERIIADCTATLAAFPDDVIALVRRGGAWYRQKNYDNAITDFGKVLKADADRADALYIRGLAFSKKGEQTRAIIDFTDAISRGLEERCLPDCYYNRGRCRYLKGAYDDAVGDLTAAIRLNPQHAKAYTTRGLVWQSIGDYRRAISDYDRAIRNDPQSVDAYHNRGNAWTDRGKFRKAIADFTQAIHLDLTSAVTYNGRGVAWRCKGRYAEALADYERTLELDPHSAQRHLVLGVFLAGCPQRRYRDGARALELITEACRLTDYSDAGYLDGLAAAHAEQGDFPSAIASQRKALELATEDDEKEAMRDRLELYASGEPWRMESPTWRQRWA